MRKSIFCPDKSFSLTNTALTYVPGGASLGKKGPKNPFLLYRSIKCFEANSLIFYF